MARHFNTAGPCRPEVHYMLPPERRLPGQPWLVNALAYVVTSELRRDGAEAVTTADI